MIKTGPLQIGRGNEPNLSHISFLDDLVVIVEASMDQDNMIKKLLDNFCLHSGQNVSEHKSKVFFSTNTSSVKACHLSQALVIEQTDDLRIYLGAPPLHQRISKNIFSDVLHEMK